MAAVKGYQDNAVQALEREADRRESLALKLARRAAKKLNKQECEGDDCDPANPVLLCQPCFDRYLQAHNAAAQKAWWAKGDK